MPTSNVDHPRAVGWGATLPGHGACVARSCGRQRAWRMRRPGVRASTGHVDPAAVGSGPNRLPIARPRPGTHELERCGMWKRLFRWGSCLHRTLAIRVQSAGARPYQGMARASPGRADVNRAWRMRRPVARASIGHGPCVAPSCGRQSGMARASSGHAGVNGAWRMHRPVVQASTGRGAHRPTAWVGGRAPPTGTAARPGAGRLCPVRAWPAGPGRPGCRRRRRSVTGPLPARHRPGPRLRRPWSSPRC